jgi:hypothetical protein
MGFLINVGPMYENKHKADGSEVSVTLRFKFNNVY